MCLSFFCSLSNLRLCYKKRYTGDFIKMERDRYIISERKLVDHHDIVYCVLILILLTEVLPGFTQ